MPHRTNDPDGHDLDEREFPDEADQDADDESDTAPCPECGQEIHHEAQRCPHCGWYVTTLSGPTRIPPWFWLGAIAVLAIVLLWLATR